MKKTVILTLLLFIGCTSLFCTATYAGEYESTVPAIKYGNYEIPSYDGDPSEPVNRNSPTFSSSELSGDPVVSYGSLDSLKRCTPAFGRLNKSLMPTGTRGDISSVYPSGWVQATYDIVSGKYLYNRCHLVGWQLTGADLDTLPKAELSKNLITGTRYLNVGDGKTGMLEYENIVASYLRKSDNNKVAYKVTPVFLGDNLVASGVLMEAKSIGSSEIQFCAFCYNVQPGVSIDYETGKSKLSSADETNTPISSCEISLSNENLTYTGQARKKSVTVRDGGNLLKEGVSYKVSYKNNVYPGRAHIILTGIGGYKGIVDKAFIIVPDKGKLGKIQRKKKGFKTTASVSTTKGVSGYQLAFKYKNAKWKYKTQKSKYFTIKKLKKKSVYTVRIRAYTTVDGKKQFGPWSMTKKIKTK